MIDMFRGVGERLLSKGYSTPFLNVGSTYMYRSLEAAKAAVTDMGEDIASQGLPKDIAPMTFVFTGRGNVSEGAQEIFKLVPHEMLEPADLKELHKAHEKGDGFNSMYGGSANKLYGSVVDSSHMVERRDGSGDQPFDRNHYYEHPEAYRPTFHNRIAPYTSVLMNCMYWDQRFPRLLTIEQMGGSQLKGPDRRLIGVGDVTCDVGGSVEFLVRDTDIEQPCYMYDFDTQTASKPGDLGGEGCLMLGVDILPSELPREASKHFGDLLESFVPQLGGAVDDDDLPAPLKGAMITSKGKLTEAFSHIALMRAERERAVKLQLSEEEKKRAGKTTLLIQGHLFDTGLINSVLDVCEEDGAGFEIQECMVSPNVDQDQRTSSVVLQVEHSNRAQLELLIGKIRALSSLVPKSSAQVSELPFTKRTSLSDPTA
jgi:alpha-aminoadipic semialdehyde synthase